jgi:sulfur-carrier protein
VPTVAFTPNLQRHVECPTERVDGATVRAVLDAVFASNPRLRGYVLDDQGALRRHMMIFIDGQQIDDRVRLSDPVRATSEVYVMQALSGGM